MLEDAVLQRRFASFQARIAGKTHRLAGYPPRADIQLAIAIQINEQLDGITPRRDIVENEQPRLAAGLSQGCIPAFSLCAMQLGIQHSRFGALYFQADICSLRANHAKCHKPGSQAHARYIPYYMLWHNRDHF